MLLVRYCPYEIQKLNLEEQFIENFELHNIIVILYKLIATNAASSYIIVK